MLKEAVVLAALALSSPTVIDGDTVRIAGISIRLTDYDAPELFSPKCPREYAQARAAKTELERLISQVKLEIVPCATSNYGRLCAEGTINGKPLAQHMISRNLAVPYLCRPGQCPPKRGAGECFPWSKKRHQRRPSWMLNSSSSSSASRGSRSSLWARWFTPAILLRRLHHLPKPEATG